MIKFTELLERAETEKIAIHTPTEKQAKALLKALDKRGYEWNSGDKLTKIKYELFEVTTCYNFSLDSDGSLLNKKVICGPLFWYRKDDYTIVEFKDIDWKGDWYILV